jgi:hypothetical protein
MMMYRPALLEVTQFQDDGQTWFERPSGVLLMSSEENKRSVTNFLKDFLGGRGIFNPKCKRLAVLAASRL